MVVFELFADLVVVMIVIAIHMMHTSDDDDDDVWCVIIPCTLRTPHTHTNRTALSSVELPQKNIVCDMIIPRLVVVLEWDNACCTVFNIYIYGTCDWKRGVGVEPNELRAMCSGGV